MNSRWEVIKGVSPVKKNINFNINACATIKSDVLIEIMNDLVSHKLLVPIDTDYQSAIKTVILNDRIPSIQMNMFSEGHCETIEIDRCDIITAVECAVEFGLINIELGEAYNAMNYQEMCEFTNIISENARLLNEEL